MKFKKPHFWYSKNQRNGVLFLLLVIVVLQLTYSFVDFSTNEKVFNDEEIGVLESKIDSLKKIEIESRKPIIYPFNPNYITDDKGLQLGMSIEEIDRLFDFRKKNAFINSVKEFQNITKVSDILLNKISPYFKFPDWVVKQNQPKITALSHKKIQIKTSTININLATVSDLESINGVPKYLAERIIKYREKLQGFTFEDQLFDPIKPTNFPAFY